MYKNRINIKFRKKIILLVYFSLIFLISLRYFYLQLIKYEKFSSEGESNSLRQFILTAPRGLIFDRNEEFLVDNQLIYDINIIPKDFDSSTFNYDIVYKELGLNKETLDSIVMPRKKNRVKQFLPVLIKRHVDFDVKAILEENKLSLKGIHFSTFPARKYSSNANLTHVLGHLREQDREIVGSSGLEKFYEKKLKGTNGVEYYYVDSYGINQGKFSTGKNIDKNYNPIQGDSLILTINKKLQSYCEKISNDYKGSIIVMNPDNGEIYAMNSFPDYSLDSFVGPITKQEWNSLKNSQDNVFYNRSIQNTYPPGSIFKLLLGLIALENNTINKDWTVDCNGVYQFYDTKFHCWKEDGHGKVNLNSAIKQSCNVYFYNLMQKIDFDFWHKEVLKFGFNKPTFIDLPTEKKGLIPNRSYMTNTYKDKGGWSTGHLLNLSIGQGEMLVTPIQIMNLINAISNEGFYFTPHLNIDKDKVKKNIPYDKSVYKAIKNSMFDAVNKNNGTAYNAKSNYDFVKTYGKTGTVQLCSNCDIEPHGWFAGFIDIGNGKKFSVCILIENGGKGSNIPSIMARNIFNFIVGNDV